MSHISPLKISRVLKYEIILYARHICHEVNRGYAVKVQRFSTDTPVFPIPSREG